MKLIVLDSEGIGLNHNATKLHNLCTTQDGEDFFYTTDYDEMREELLSADLLVCHNILGHDVPAFKAVLGIDIPWEKCIDTLTISWALYPDRPKHGLASWGADVGVEKVYVAEDQWEEGDPELMKSRVIEDTKINWKVWLKMSARLDEIYGDDQQGKMKYLKYLSWKAQMLRLQQESPIKLDVKAVEGYIKEFEGIKEEKVKALTEAMPKRPVLTKKAKPKVTHKKDGSLSSNGQKWYDFLSEQGLPKDTVGPVNYISGYEEPNPNSSDQVKTWLYSLGWKPRTYKYTRNKITGEEKKIEQIRKDGLLCESVIDLIEKEPALEQLEDLTVLTHRIGVLKSFLAANEGGSIVASAGGLTNTLRYQHRKPFVNLPSVEAKFGKAIRHSIIAPKGMVVSGSDVSSLESKTKQHYMYPHDPEYVKEMCKPDFCEHLDLAVHAGAISKEEYNSYFKLKEDHSDELELNRLTKIRKVHKPVSYGGIYGIGAAGLSRQTGMPLIDCEELLKAYWDRNWSVKKVAKQQYVKTLKDGTMWLKNQVNGFYYSLRFEKDRWSTTNQGTGVYFFDTWVYFCIQSGLIPSGQMHDEIIVYCEKGKEEETKRLMVEACKKANEALKLNVEIGIEVQFGESYGDVH